MKWYKKSIAVILIFTTFLTINTPAALAGEAQVTIDETVYVNMDHYGKFEKMSIVKGISLNGNNTFTDYGNYESVINMTNEIAPVLSQNAVKWSLPENIGRFYYQCTPKGGYIKIPWSFDISYKLNGVPINADKLAGASGLVEIDIKAMPNENISDYYKNNMILMVETTVDMEKNKSVEAPGSQLQTVGNYKAVVFVGLPGEENEFVIRIGTDSFETTGIMMTMVPATLKQIEDIKELKENKEDIEDSVNAAYESMNDILNTLSQTSKGLSQIQSGMFSFDKVNKNFSASEDELFASGGKSIDDLTPVIIQMNNLVPHLQEAQEMVQEVNEDLNSLTDTLNELQPSIRSMIRIAGDIKSDLTELIDIIEETADLSRDRDDLLDNLKKNIDDLKALMKAMSLASNSLSSDMTELKISLAGLDRALGNVSTIDTGDATVNTLNYEIADLMSQTQMLTKTADVLASSGDMVQILHKMSADSDDLVDTGIETADLLESYFDIMDDGTSSAESLLKDLKKAIRPLKNMLSTGETLIDNATELNNTLNSYKDGIVDAIKNTEELMSGLAVTMQDTQSFLTTLYKTLESSRKDIDDGTSQSLSGLIDVLQNALDGIEKTGTLKKSNDTFKRIFDHQMEKLDETNFINMDNTAKMISFTSSQNPPPSSIQIIMRTEEISIDDQEDAVYQDERKQDVGVFQRICNIFQKIWHAIKTLFN